MIRRINMKKSISVIFCLGILSTAHFVMARGSTALTAIKSLMGSEATGVFFTII